MHGVSFASAASGYDDLTANISVKPLKTFLFASNSPHYINVFNFDMFFLSGWMEQNVLPVSKQLEYFLHYKIHLRKVVGEKKAKDIVKYGVFVMSMGTNDFLQNYYLQSMRTDQFTLTGYQNYLVSCMSHDIEVLSLSVSSLLLEKKYTLTHMHDYGSF